jgi:hypothetical protein
MAEIAAGRKSEIPRHLGAERFCPAVGALPYSGAMTSPQLQPSLPPENVLRGSLFALIALPLGVLVWLLIWSFGFIASIVAFGVAIAAAFFYRVGAGGRISKLGGWIVTAVTVVTLVVAWFAGLALDVVRYISDESGVSWLEALNGPYFAELYALVIRDPYGDLITSAIATIAFGALGSFSVLRSIFKQAKLEAEVPIAPAATPAGFEPITPTGYGTITPPPPAPAAEPEPDSSK